MNDHAIITKRLKLRRWRESDRKPLAQLNSDPVVCEFLAGVQTRAECDLYFDKIQAHFEEYGYGFWAVEILATKEFAGFIGLRNLSSGVPFAPCIEIAWRLQRQFWRQGLASEGARAVLDYARETLDLNDIVAFTTIQNRASRRVMEKVGMIRDLAGDFGHDSLALDHPHRPHVLYRQN